MTGRGAAASLACGATQNVRPRHELFRLGNLVQRLLHKAKNVHSFFLILVERQDVESLRRIIKYLGD